MGRQRWGQRTWKFKGGWDNLRMINCFTHSPPPPSFSRAPFPLPLMANTESKLGKLSSLIQPSSCSPDGWICSFLSRISISSSPHSFRIFKMLVKFWFSYSSPNLNFIQWIPIFIMFYSHLIRTRTAKLIIFFIAEILDLKIIWKFRFFNFWKFIRNNFFSISVWN